MATEEGETPSNAEDTGADAPQKESEFTVEVGVRCFGKVNGKWFEGQIVYHSAKKQKLLFRVERSAIGRVNFVDVANPMVWVGADQFHALDNDPTDGCEVRRAKTWMEQEPPLKKKNLDYEYGSQTTTSYSTGSSSYWVQNERASCGFAGLKNQGATCYLNSLLQSYYMTPRLREALFRFRYDESSKEPKERCVPYQLQRLFAHMQLCKMQATDTKGLTDSFGWKAEDVYQQHDVVELATILLSHLEERSKDEKLINIVKEYKVATADYVKCLTCGNRNERPDVMVAVQLNIENVRSMEESLKNFCAPETLDGDNKYMCSKCNSKQPAKKGIRFTKFKDFVAFQLNRWTLDWATLERKKIRERINFPFRINMSKYLVDPDLDDDDEEREEVSAQEKSSIVWKLSFQGVKDPAALMKDFEFGVANTVGTSKDEVSLTILDTDADGLCVLQVDVHSRDPESVSSIVQEKEAFANGFMRHMQTHAGDRGVDLEDSLQLTDVGEITVTKLKQEYELYAMMIHRGGAYGGHYFAYIKHPREDRYFVFNDSRVEEIEADELAEMFDENCQKPKRDSPLSGAYMLLYRRVGCVAPECSPDLLPEEIRAEIDKANADWEKRAAERKARDLEVSIQVHFNDKKEKVKMEKTDVTQSAISKARIALKVDAELEDDLFRLRFYESGAPRTPLSDEDKTLSDWNVSSRSTQLYLEQRSKGEEWPECSPTMKTIHLKIVNVDAERFCYREERDIDVIKRGTIGDLRQQIAAVMECPDKKIKLWKKRPNQSLPDSLDDNSSPVQWINREVFVELCEDYSLKHAAYKTKTHFQELSYQSEIKYIKFDGSINTLMFDNRKTLGDLRAHFAEMLERDPYSFCMEREPLSSYIAKWLDLSNKDGDTLRQLDFAARFRQPKLRLVDKPGLKPGQMKIKVKFQDRATGEWVTYFPNKDDVSDSVVVVDTTAKYDQVRQFFADLKPFGDDLDPQKLRIRKIWPNSGSIKEALDETMTLKDMNVYDKMWVGVQILDEPEVLKKTDRLVMICQWFPEKKKCGEKLEMKIDATMKVKDGTLSKWFEEKFGIEAEHVRFQKTHSYYINQGQCANLDWELVEIPASATLVRQPVLLKHGDSIVFKDNREKETGAVYVKRSSFKFSSRRAERGIKIHAFGDAEKDEDKDEKSPSSSAGGGAPAEAESGEEMNVVGAVDEEKMEYVEENPKIEEMNVIPDYVATGSNIAS